MINWHITIFTEWPMVIYYFHSFSEYLNKLKAHIQKIIALCQCCLLTQYINYPG